MPQTVEIERRRAYQRELYRRKHPPQPPRSFYSEKHGRIVVREKAATSIFWSTDMLDYLRRHYATTLNDELAGCLGVSKRTMIRKARQLGLTKDKAWLMSIWVKHCKLAQWLSSRAKRKNGEK